MIARNIAHQAVLAGYSVLSTTAAELIEDLRSCSPETLRRRLARYTRPHLLCIDEVGYLSYDSHAADLLYKVVDRRYERPGAKDLPSRSILITTNLAFRDWNTVFPNATSIATLLDKLTHHADVTLHRGRELPRPRKPEGGRGAQEKEVVTTARQAYVNAVVRHYVRLPGTPLRASRRDRQLAAALYDRRVPLRVVWAAFVIAAVRWAIRGSEQRKLDDASAPSTTSSPPSTRCSTPHPSPTTSSTSPESCGPSSPKRKPPSWPW